MKGDMTMYAGKLAGESVFTQGPRDFVRDGSIFDWYCRTEGTRINEIMGMLEHGYPIEHIAKKYNTDTQTISVYKKALEGRLSRGTGYHQGDGELTWLLVYRMRKAGISYSVIESRLNLTPTAARDYYSKAVKALGMKRGCGV